MPALILDGECHNGQYAQSLGPGHWRFEARGDTGHYCYYFQFTLNSPDAGEAVVEVAPDRELMPESAGSFRRSLSGSCRAATGSAIRLSRMAPGIACGSG
jgi:hypothetical protein